MSSTPTRGTDAWVERISNKEMPALCSTVRMLEQMAKDDTASLAHLGQSVLHDHGLTTRILRVANSVTYSRSGNQVTTMSRAAVLLGFNALKHICITATLVDSLLKNRDISQSVYDRLLRLMAQSFHAGMLSKMLLETHDEETREEAFIAALLHNLGESAFWSMGGPLAEELDDKLRLNPDAEEEVVRDMLGTSFNKMSIGLASSWNMGKLLIASLTDPDRRTPEVQAINLANRFSALMMNPHTTQAQLQQGLNELGKVMELDAAQVKQKVKRCNFDAVRLSTTYGARMLTPYLDKGANALLLPEQEPEPAPQPAESSEALQLRMLRELTFLTLEKADINLIIHTALEGIYRGIGMDRVLVLMLNREKNRLTPRFVTGQQGDLLKQRFTLDVSARNHLFSQLLSKQEPQWITSLTDPKWSPLVSPELRTAVYNKGFFIAPIIVEQQSIGLFYADRADSKRVLSRDDFFSFTHFVQQTNLCLAAVIKQKE